MTGWIIAGAVLLLILLLLMCRVTVIFDYNGSIYLRVSVLCFTVFRIPQKELTERQKKRAAIKARKKAKKKALKDAKKAEKKALKEAKEAEEKESKKSEEKKKEKPSIEELIELAKVALESLGKPLKKILKRIEFSHLSLDMICGGEDAAKAAINYGAANIALGSALSTIDTFFTLKTPDDLHIGVDFYQEKTVIKLYCEIRLTVGAALAFVFTLLGRAVRLYLKNSGAKSAVKKLAG
ncbi:MAG: hypothetical protein J1F09_06075 [Oscillospiraceae bacterium]|nr:hypothetical protein [Oscillospiraceae bacterium]